MSEQFRPLEELVNETPMYQISLDTEPYIQYSVTRVYTLLTYNPAYGDSRECKCGHSYYRHFDSYEDMDPIGCKYCQCYTFEEKANVV